MEPLPGPSRGRPPPPRRKLSFPAALQISPDQPTHLLHPAVPTKRRFSQVGDAVSRKLSTTIGWRRPSEEVMAVGRALCALYIRSRLKRAGLFTRKLGLNRVKSTVGAVPGSGAATVRDVFPSLASACTELERLYPRLYCNVARQAGLPRETGAGELLAAVGVQLFKVDPNWGKVVAVFSVAGGLAMDCVRMGKQEHLMDIVEGMNELLEDRLAVWVATNGGWAGLNVHCRQENQDISVVEYFTIFVLVVAILLVAYIVVRFFVKFSML